MRIESGSQLNELGCRELLRFQPGQHAGQQRQVTRGAFDGADDGSHPPAIGEVQAHVDRGYKQGRIPQPAGHPNDQTNYPQSRHYRAGKSQDLRCQHRFAFAPGRQCFRRRKRLSFLRQHRQVLAQIQSPPHISYRRLAGTNLAGGGGRQ
ncbi:MAG: hypothetical protein WAO35_15450 [Terriglobia bacterium]